MCDVHRGITQHSLPREGRILLRINTSTTASNLWLVGFYWYKTQINREKKYMLDIHQELEGVVGVFHCDSLLYYCQNNCFIIWYFTYFVGDDIENFFPPGSGLETWPRTEKGLVKRTKNIKIYWPSYFKYIITILQ